MPAGRRIQILHMLCDGAIGANERITGCSKHTIGKLLNDASKVCADYQDKVLRNPMCKRVQVDEMWSFT